MTNDIVITNEPEYRTSEIGSDPLWREASAAIDMFYGLGYGPEDIDQIIRWEGVILRKLSTPAPSSSGPSTDHLNELATAEVSR